MELPRVLVAIFDFFKLLWTLFTGDSPKPNPTPVDLPFYTKPIPPHSYWLKSIELPVDSPKPFRLLNLPSLAHDVIFSEMSTEELYHLSKCSTRSRYAVKMFTRRQKYDFNITAGQSYCSLDISNRLGRTTFNRELKPLDNTQLLGGAPFITHSEDFWAATKEEIAHCFDVFTKKVNFLKFLDITYITKMTEFLKSATPLPVGWVIYEDSEIDDEMYKYVLRELKDVTALNIHASPPANFRFEDMDPFTGDFISIKDADWLTFDILTRCFMNGCTVWLWTSTNRYLNVLVFNQFLTAWRDELIVGKLDLWCDCTNIDLRSILKNVPKTEVKRVEVRNKKTVFNDGQCFLIRQEESGMEALVYFNPNNTFMNHRLCVTTKFRLLRDDESDEDSFDNDND